MNKVVIIGCPGTGKTTFANKLGRKLNIPVFHLDKYFWKEARTPTPQDEFKKIQDELMSGDKWILDGNFTKSIDNRIAKADTVILFEVPRIVALWRTIKRFLKNLGRVRPDMGGGNKEALKWVHLKYIATFPVQEFHKRVFNLAQGKKVVVFYNSKDVANFLDGVGS